MPTADQTGTGVAAGAEDESTEGAQGENSTNLLAFASVAVSALGFFAFLRLADGRRDRTRTRARAFGLFLATSLGSITGTILGTMAARRSRKPSQHRALLLGISGAALGSLTTMLNIHRMRTRTDRLARLVAAEL
jgi:cation transporter-like permease